MAILLKKSGQDVFCPFYHSSYTDTSLSHIKHLYQLRSLSQFEQDIDYLLQHFQPLSLEDAAPILRGERKAARPSFFLSFDDGLRQVYDLIAPLLWKKGVPATLFINSAFVDNKGLFFRYKASLLIEQLIQAPLTTAQTKAIKNQFASFGLSYRQPANLLQIGYADRQLLDAIASELEFSFDDFLQKEQPYLTTAQLLELQAKGFSIGAHSVDHPLYSEIPFVTQLQQTEQSLVFVNTHFPAKTKSFSFPFTDDQVRLAFFEHLKQNQLTDLSFGSAGLKKDTAPQHIQRFPMEVGQFPAATLVKAAYFYYIVKDMLGKNTIRRQ